MPYAVSSVAMVRDAYEIPELELVYAGFLLYFAECCHADVFAWILMPLGQVPETVSADKKEVTSSIGYQASSGIDFQELGTDHLIGRFYVCGRDVYSMQGFGNLHHLHKIMDVCTCSDVEQDCIRVCQCKVIGRADYDTSLFEVDFVHLTYNFINFAGCVRMAREMFCKYMQKM
jgi:hypothetical protein